MKKLKIQDAVGRQLCHDITEMHDGFKGAAFKRGHIVRECDIEHMLRVGKQHIFVWEDHAGEIHEDDCAKRMAAMVPVEGAHYTEPAEGKVLLIADQRGMFRVNRKLLNAINSIGDITICTLPFGIPVDLKFSTRQEKAKAREELGIENKTTIFVITGSMGFGNTEKYIRALDQMDGDFQIISVCGNNKSMKNRIDALETRKKLYNFGYVNNVDMIMDASDIIVTKPGGLTVSEAISKNIPMILVDPIPGQEDRNREFLINTGMAVGVSKLTPIDDVVNTLLTYEERRNQLCNMQSALGKPFAAKELGDFIIDFVEKK